MYYWVTECRLFRVYTVQLILNFLVLMIYAFTYRDTTVQMHKDEGQ